jgi:uncharacterized membrane protein
VRVASAAGMALSINAAAAAAARIQQWKALDNQLFFLLSGIFFYHMSLSRRAIITVEERTKSRLFRRILKKCPLVVAGKQC